jgi:hypothetical protein
MPELITKEFRHDYSEAEAHALAIDLAEGIKKLKAILAEKKEVVKKYTADADKVKLACDDLSIKVSDGFEMRDVQCWVDYNKPTTGQKQITRIDTAEVFTEQMTEEDWTLFNQA